MEVDKENLQWIRYFDELNKLIEVKILNMTTNYDENSQEEQKILFF